MNNQQNPLLEVPAEEEANNYSRILAILGIEEEGDPVAEVRRLAAAEAEQQRAIDSALLTIADEYDKAECLTTCTSYAHDDLCPWVNTGNYIRSRVGTNPLAELQARNAELGQQLEAGQQRTGEMVLLPREPNVEMVEAFYRAYERPLNPDRWESHFSNAWEALIAEAEKSKTPT